MAETSSCPYNTVVVVSCPTSLLEQATPPQCNCGAKSFHRHGSYHRSVADVCVPRVRCTSCGQTHSLLTTDCVPFKHYPTRDIEAAVAGRIDGQTTLALELQIGVSRTTVARWAGDFVLNLTLLVMTLQCQHGYRPMKPQPRPAYEGMQGHCRVTRPFALVQRSLSTKWPIVGLFHPVTQRPVFLSDPARGLGPRGQPP